MAKELTSWIISFWNRKALWDRRLPLSFPKKKKKRAFTPSLTFPKDNDQLPKINCNNDS